MTDTAPLPPDANENSEHRRLRLDRLIDGELESDERRELLLELEHHPEGWRECALAFLEAQELTAGLSTLMSTAASFDALDDAKAHSTQIKVNRAGTTHGSPTTSVERPTLVAAYPRRAPSWMSTMAIAAGLMVAFSVGIASRGIWSESRDSLNVRPLASTSDRISTQRGDLAGGPAASVAETTNVSEVRIPFGDATGARLDEVVVPVVENDSSVPFFSRPEGQIPADVLRMLQQYGPLKRTRGYLPTELGDGRRVVVPMERIHVRPVTPAYQ